MAFERIRSGLDRRTIFISYRRTDSGGYAGQLRDFLQGHYGSRVLYLDHADTDAGDRWKARLAAALDAADVVLVVIGPDWLTTPDEDGHRKLDEPTDWVRREVDASLAKPETRVIPVLVGGARLPSTAELPESMADLPERQSREVRPDAFRVDARRLVRAIGGWRSQIVGLPIYVWPMIVLVLGALAWLVVQLARPDANRPPEVLNPVSAGTDAGVSTEIDLLANASDDGGTVTVANAGPLSRAGGRVEQVDGRLVRYTPPPAYHGDDEFEYGVVDDAGAETRGRVLVEVRIGPMTGEFNVAVVQFTSISPDGSPVESAAAQQWSGEIYQLIDAELEKLRSEGFRFEVRGPSDAGAITGSTREERAASAEELATGIAADVVVYGTLTDDAVAPEFFIQARGDNLANAEELTGDYELGDRILGSELTMGRITENAETRLALVDRASALTQFVIGLSYYGGRDYGDARNAFERADIPAWQDSDGKELLYLFLGNAAGKLGQFDQAAADYDDALTLNPDFARAQVGRAEIEFHWAATVEREGNCPPGEVDVAGLARSEDLYLKARTAADQPAISNVDTKSSFGLGRIYVCETFAGLAARADEARAMFGEVIAEFDRGNGAVKELAAESYAALGLLSYGTTDTTDPVALCDIVALYERALDLNEDEEREERFRDNQRPAVDALGERLEDCAAGG